MTVISKWKQEYIKKRAIKEMLDIEEKIRPDIDNIVDKFCDIMETNNIKDKNIEHAIVIICAHLIAGFDEQNKRIMIADMVKKTVDEMDNDT